MKIHPDVLAAHAQFGGDLETMQKAYEWADLTTENASLRQQLAEARDETGLVAIIAQIREKSGVGSKPMLDELADAIAAMIAQTRLEALLEAVSVAERDADWTAFGKRGLEPWEGGPDATRDYRLGIVAGRAIAVAIRALFHPDREGERE